MGIDSLQFLRFGRSGLVCGKKAGTSRPIFGDHSMNTLIKTARKFIREEEGASLAEYGLLLALIAVVCIGAITALGGSISGMFSGLSTSI
jgi:pilus assembly protein Flp/PilA